MWWVGCGVYVVVYRYIIMPLRGPTCKIARFQAELKFPSWTECGNSLPRKGQFLRVGRNHQQTVGATPRHHSIRDSLFLHQNNHLSHRNLQTDPKLQDNWRDNENHGWLACHRQISGNRSICTNQAIKKAHHILISIPQWTSNFKNSRYQEYRDRVGCWTGRAWPMCRQGDTWC